MMDQGIAASPTEQVQAPKNGPNEYVAYRPAWSSRTLNAMPSTSSLATTTTNSTYPGPQPGSSRVVSGSSDSSDNLRTAPRWVKQYAESNERLKRSPKSTTPRQPWDMNDYPQTRSPEELPRGPQSPKTGHNRIASNASEKQPVGLGLTTDPRNSSSSTSSYFPPPYSLEETTDRHLRSSTSSASIGGGPMSLAQQIALDERKKKAQAELARLQADEDERLRTIESNTEVEQSQAIMQQSSSPLPIRNTSTSMKKEPLHEGHDASPRILDHMKPPGPPELKFVSEIPPELHTEPASIVTPELPTEPQRQSSITKYSDNPPAKVDSRDGGSLFSDLDDLVSKLGSRRKSTTAYVAPRPPRPQIFSTQTAEDVPDLPELPAHHFMAPKHNAFELSTSDSVRRPKPRVPDTIKVHEPHPATQFELSSSDSVARRPKSSGKTNHTYPPIDPPHSTHSELSTSLSVLRRPQSQNFAPPHNKSGSLKPPNTTHSQLNMPDPVLRRPKSQNFAPTHDGTRLEPATSEPALRRPKSQNFIPPYSGAPLVPPPATHHELSTSNSVLGRPKSQSVMPRRDQVEDKTLLSLPLYQSDDKQDQSDLLQEKNTRLATQTTQPTQATQARQSGAWFDSWQAKFEATQKFDIPIYQR